MQDGVELETETQTLLTASVCCSEHYRLLSHTPLHPRLTIVRVILLVRVNITSHTEPGPHVTADTQTVTLTIVVWQNLSGPNVKWDLEPAAREGWGGRVEGRNPLHSTDWEGNNCDFHPSTIDPVEPQSQPARDQYLPDAK